MQTSELVLYLAEHGSITTDDAVRRYEVSVRTVRACIKTANERLAGIAAIVYERAFGAYVLEVHDQQAFDSWRARAVALAKTWGDHDEPEGRLLYLLSDLLLRNTWVTIAHYSDSLYVSAQSISADIKRAEDFMGTYGLKLLRKPHYGVMVEGPEISRRLCLASVASTSDPADSTLSNGQTPAAGIFDHDLVSDVQCIARDILRSEDFKIVPASFRNLVLHIVIAVERLRRGGTVCLDAKAFDRIRALLEFRAANSIATALEDCCGVSIPQYEVAYIAIQLAGKRMGSIEDASAAENADVISSEAWEKVDKIFEVIWKEFHFDFRDDDELRLNLGTHIAPLLIRLKYQMQLENPMVYDIKASFPLAYLMAHASSAVFDQESGVVLSEDEMGYIALAFALALDRKKGAPIKRRILALYSSSAGSVRMFEHCLRRDFGTYIESLDLRDSSEFDDIDLSRYDCVFSTVGALKGKQLGVPVIEVSPFFDETQRRHIERFFAVWDTRQSAMLAFSPTLFYPHLTVAPSPSAASTGNPAYVPNSDINASDCITKDDVIAELCRRVRAVMELPSEFEALVAKREGLAPTAFGNLTALPHPAEAITDSTFVAVGLLDEPVVWSGHQVQAVFLLSISKQAGTELESFYTSMVRLLTSPSSIERLVNEQHFEVLLEELQATQQKGQS